LYKGFLDHKDNREIKKGASDKDIFLFFYLCYEFLGLLVSFFPPEFSFPKIVVSFEK